MPGYCRLEPACPMDLNVPSNDDPLFGLLRDKNSLTPPHLIGSEAQDFGEPIL